VSGSELSRVGPQEENSRVGSAAAESNRVSGRVGSELESSLESSRVSSRVESRLGMSLGATSIAQASLARRQQLSLSAERCPASVWWKRRGEGERARPFGGGEWARHSLCPSVGLTGLGFASVRFLRHATSRPVEPARPAGREGCRAPTTEYDSW